jgi:hypothetical protein
MQNGTFDEDVSPITSHCDRRPRDSRKATPSAVLLEALESTTARAPNKSFSTR